MICKMRRYEQPHTTGHRPFPPPGSLSGESPGSARHHGSQGANMGSDVEPMGTLHKSTAKSFNKKNQKISLGGRKFEGLFEVLNINFYYMLYDTLLYLNNSFKTALVLPRILILSSKHCQQSSSTFSGFTKLKKCRTNLLNQQISCQFSDPVSEVAHSS